MKNKIYTIYHFISPPSDITHESVDLTNKVLEKMRNLTFESQTDSITIEPTPSSSFIPQISYPHPPI